MYGASAQQTSTYRYHANGNHHDAPAEERATAAHAELRARLAAFFREDGTLEPLPGVLLHRSSAPREPLLTVYDPVFCVIAQGSKEVFLGETGYRYDPARYLLVTAELPLVGHVLEASAAQPYFSFRVKLEPALVGAVLMEAGRPAPSERADDRAISVGALDADLLDAVVRLARLFDSPAEARFLAPLIKRELVYRLMLGGQEERLGYIAALGGNTHRIVNAIGRFRREYDRNLRMETVAGDLGMSVSSFHHHFKAVTGLSPLQFQKRVRLQEARRLLLNEQLDAASTAFRVGYDDASHFSREYKRLFGLPPMQDVAQLRTAGPDTGGAHGISL